MSSIYTNGNDSYFYSNKIKVFPCAYRNNTYDATARLNTEYNFTHLPHTVDKASYIIEFDNDKLICVIQGYYFEIELGTNDSGISDYSILYNKNKNKYLNICVASPSGAGSIESPHLCSWDSSDGVEATLDGKPEGSDYYIFKGLKIGKGALSNGSYQCYALKLDASAKLPIMANKIENSAGVPISASFTTETLSATTSISTPSLNVASGKLTVNSGNITANVPVTINNTLEVKDSTATTSILKAESEIVTINKPTNITGTTTIKGTTQINKSSSEATDGNLKVEGTGEFGGKLTVTAGGTDIIGNTQIKKSSSGATDGNLTVAGTVGITGKTTIGANKTLTEIENDTIKTSKITIEKALGTGSLVIDKTKNNIIEIKDNSNTLIFSVDTNSGETFAKKINATVEGISDNAVNVTDSIGNISISSIFETNGSVVRKASSLTATSSTGSAGNIIITGNTTGTVDALIPAKTTGRTYNIGSSTKTFDNIYATTFHGSLDGNANTATSAGNADYATSAGSATYATSAGEFKTAASITLEGDVITNTAATGTHDWTIKTTIQNDAVTTDKILDGNVTNDKLEHNTIKIANSPVLLGNSIGTANNDRIIGTLYLSGINTTGQIKIKAADDSTKTTTLTNQEVSTTSLNLSGDMSVNDIGNIKVNKASLQSSSLIKVDGSNVKLCDSALVVASNSVKLCSTALVVTSASVAIGSKLTLTPSSGNIVSEGTISANTFNATSDRRLKENIIDYKPEKSILDLPIKKFDFIDGPKNQIGCIAQDLKEICPEIVNENEKGYLSIQESKLVYLLLDEVKKLRNEVEKLKHK